MVSRLIIALAFFSSCTLRRQVVYLHDLPDSVTGKLEQAQTRFSAPIEKSDLLSIRINGLNPTDVLIVNPGAANTNLAGSGYVPDEEGNLELPFIGKLKAEGLTRSQLEQQIHAKMKNFLQDPVVQVRYINSHVTVLGDVFKPGEIRPATERLTLLEAIGQAGDLKLTARRENVLIIREEKGHRHITRLDLTSKSILTSPYFYLKNNDVIYVEPIKSSYSSRNDTFFRFFTVGASLISVTVSILLLTRR